MRITCLHTHPDNVRVFQNACPPGVDLTHHVRSDFLKRASEGIDKGLEAELQVQISRLGRNAEAVLVTCSALGPIIPKDCYSADAILAEQIELLGAGKTLEVLFTNPGSEAPTTKLFSELKSPESTKVTLVEGAWPHFLAGESSEYIVKIADAVDQTEADHVVFAQASMTLALPLCSREVWSVPFISLPWLSSHLQMQAAQ